MIDETILFRARPAEVHLSVSQRAAFWALLVVGGATLSAAIAVSSTLHVPVGSMTLMAGWCVAIALAYRAAIQRWHEGAEYLVTDQRVLWRRGRFARSIDRAGISFARITWLDPVRGIGDLELVRDVAEGVLRRKLTIELRGVKRPDVLWDIIRAGGKDKRKADETWRGRPLGQRLQDGERIVWSERPAFSIRQLVPTTGKGIAGLAMGLVLGGVTVHAAMAAWSGGRHVLDSGVPVVSVGFVALVVSTSLTALLLLSLGVAILWTSVLRPGLLLRNTRYLITNTQVLISQGDEELHLDRSKIVDVIDNPSSGGRHDLFLVVGGSPRSRSVGMSGAFDESNTSATLVPVFRLVVDAEAAEKLLKTGADLPHAA